MEFKEFRDLQRVHADKLFSKTPQLFEVDVDKEVLWNLYLDSFPAGTNEIYRERRFYDCSCCRHFIKQVGSVVGIVDNEIVTLWDFEADEVFQPVIDALAVFIKDAAVANVFVTKDKKVGVEVSLEDMGDHVHMWNHFSIPVPFAVDSHKTPDTIKGLYRDTRNVLQRSFDEIKPDAVETILDLVEENTLYRGEEWKPQLKEFAGLQKNYLRLPETKRNNYCWYNAVTVGPAVGKIRNHSIGTLLTDISDGMEVDKAVSRYEKIVAPTNYKRPKAIFTKKMLEQANDTVVRLGLEGSLGRRFATISDITINNVLWANRDAISHMAGKGGLFELLGNDVVETPKKYENITGIGIEEFVTSVLPSAKSVEVLVENRHTPNFMSLIAPVGPSKPLFKWGNSFSWAYNGNITDSMREQVVKLGGRVDGALRFTHSWNHDGQNQSLMDLHVFMPTCNYKNTYGSKEVHDHYPSGQRVGWNNRMDSKSGGNQDVDYVNEPGPDFIPIENISFPDIRKMPEGVYTFKIHNWNSRNPNNSGGKAEIEFGGQIFSFDYPKPLAHKEWLTLAEVTLKNGIFTMKEIMPANESSRSVWNVKTNTFQPVSTFMFSPNYWDGSGVGNKHYFFILNGCKTDDTPNGFFNEFLRPDLIEHKHVFEALGSRMKVAPSDEQLSGLGFSSTQQNYVICKVDSLKVIKIIF